MLGCCSLLQDNNGVCLNIYDRKFGFCNVLNAEMWDMYICAQYNASDFGPRHYA